jgi:serine protease Do
MRHPLLALLLLGTVAAAPARADDDLALRRSPVVRAVEKAGPGVVSIRTNEIVQVPRYYDWFWSNGETVPQEREGALGSGAIFHPAGFVVTNAHVISRAARIYVQITEAGGRVVEREARLVSVDLDNDLAILRIVTPPGEPGVYPFVPLGRSDDLMIGETVIAIGNPFRLGTTVTTGIISALHRTVRPSAAGETEFKDFIQTDAAINPGNSGGPLLDVTGRWVGVTTAILNRAIGAEGIGFAIPADRVREMIGRTFKRRLVTGEWSGFELESGPGGAPVVGAVYSLGPAAGAGLKRGDRITGVGDRKVGNLFDYRIAEVEAGSELRLQVDREGRPVEVGIPLKTLPVAEIARARLGFEARDATPEDRRALGILPDGGVVISSVDPDGPGSRVHLAPRDVVTALGPFRVRNLDDLVTVLELVRPGDSVNLRVQRIVRDSYGNAGIRQLEGKIASD